LFNDFFAGVDLQTDLRFPLFIDARRYFKQSEIVLYRQAPELPPALVTDNPSVGGKQPVQTLPTPA